MITILLLFLGLVLLIFCIVDLYHLREMLKELKNIKKFMQNINWNSLSKEEQDRIAREEL
jgi:hypothetical protein